LRWDNCPQAKQGLTPMISEIVETTLEIGNENNPVLTVRDSENSKEGMI